MSVAVTLLPAMETNALAPAMVRLDPAFVAITANALLAGLALVLSAVSKMTLSAFPSTRAAVTIAVVLFVTALPVKLATSLFASSLSLLFVPVLGFM